MHFTIRCTIILMDSPDGLDTDGQSGLAQRKKAKLSNKMDQNWIKMDQNSAKIDPFSYSFGRFEPFEISQGVSKTISERAETQTLCWSK